MAENNLYGRIQESNAFLNVRPRENYLKEGHEYFMSRALLTAQRSRDPSTQVGACIVNTNKEIVGEGANNMPNGCPAGDFPWARTNDKCDPILNKRVYVCHAELNAMINKNVSGCTIYVTLFPCNECAKLLINSGIKRVVYLSDREDDAFKASRYMLNKAGVNLKSYEELVGTVRENIILNFNPSV